MPDSSADLFFRNLTSEGSDAFALVNDLIRTGVEENEWWEFKGAADLDTPFFDAHARAPDEAAKEKEKECQATIKKYWSECLSAFSNSAGGILIWGIHAPKRRAESHSFVQNATGLADRLKDLQNNATDPPVPGVKVLAVHKPGSQAGFVVCHIPNSAFSPHRANWPGFAYYLRLGDSCLPMQTEVLRRMFYPHTFPRLIPIVHLSIVKENGRLKMNMPADLKNYGSSSAQGTYVVAQTNADRPFRSYCAEQFWNVRPFGGFESKNTIHPGEKISLLANFANQAAYESPDDLVSLSFTFRIFAQDAPPFLATVTFGKQELWKAALHGETIDREAMIAPLEIL